MASENDILIKPIVATYGDEEFTCQGAGLLKDGHAFEPDLTQYLPKLTKRGVVSLNQPKSLPRLPQGWWRAQCVFRDLEIQGSVKDIQDRAREYEDRGGGMDPEIEKFEEEANAKFWKDNEQAKQDAWEAVEKRARNYPREFVREHFPNGVVGDEEAVALKSLSSNQRAQLHRACEEYGGLYHQSTYSGRDRCIVVGSRTAVFQKIAEIEREAARTRQLEEKEERRGLPENEGYDLLVQRWNYSDQDEWDVTGVWDISCPNLESLGRRCSLILGFSDGEDPETKHIWADFDFLDYTGVFRFLRPDSSEEFLVPNDSLPSPEQRRWNFRWRGEETGEGMILTSAELDLCWLRFVGSAGLKMEGQLFGVDADARFEGRKVGSSLGKLSRGFSVHAAWEQRSEAAYEAARVGRWGRY
jgi:hypothetical protein